jgi:Spy/CpxP family protein refolding chaperone
LFLAAAFFPPASASQQAGGQPPAAGARQAPAGAPQQDPRRGGGPGGPSGQRTPGYFEWWKDEKIKAELTLTSAQTRRIDGIFHVRSARLARFEGELDRLRTALDQMLRERTVDEETFAVQAALTHSTRSRLFEGRDTMFYAMYRELTPAQYQKLREIFDRRRGGRGGGSTR